MKVNATNSNQYLNNANQAKTAGEKALSNIAATRALSGVDGADMIIADSLLSQSNVLNQGIANANDAIGMLNIADSTLSNLTQSADRLNELSVRANNPALSDREQVMLRNEAQALTDSMNQSVANASFNGKNVFGGNMEFYTGSSSQNINLDQNSITGAISSLDINSQQSIQDFMSSINSMRADIGASQNALVENITNSLTQSVALRQAESGMRNDDVAVNMADKNQADMNLNAAILAQSHNVNNLKLQLDRLLA
ncbi:Secreted flagellin C [Campylobacter majalis]|uniref:Secreted flagellin C n=1 Tax=Campylobacter majalis TaxID=2790656 RepID=A0ABM8Q913_9BACT|nr:flagellin [Campylobacter majalis]CAD7289478.1 Secreted flagellin C [Campylobacter majalis]